MANRITLRHGSTAPSASNLLPYELGWDQNTLGLYIGQPNNGAPLLISSGGGNVTGVKGNSETTYRTGQVNLTAANIGAATSNHTHALSLAADTGTSSIALAASSKYKITAGGSTYIFTTPPNTWNALSTSQAGYVAQAPNDTLKYLRGDATWAQPYEAALVWGGKNFSGSYGCIDAAMIDDLGANRFAFLKAAGLTIEYSTDGGTTWLDYEASDTAKRGIFGAGQNFYLGKATAKADNTINNQLKITIATSAAGIYTVLNKIAIYMSTQGNTVQVKIEKALESTPTTFVTHLDWTSISGWSGWNILNFSGITTYGNTASTQYGRIVLTFKQTAINSNYSSACISRILGFGGMGWTVPSNLAKNSHLYSYDNSQNATFPAQITATQFNGPLNGNATSATTFSSNATVALTGDTTGTSAGSTKSWSISTTTNQLSFKNGRVASADLDISTMHSKMLLTLASSTMTTNKPPMGDGYIVTYGWDNAYWGAQQAISHTKTPHMAIRGTNGGSSNDWGNWIYLIDANNYTDYTVTKTGTGASGTWGISISGNAATATSATSANSVALSGVTGADDLKAIEALTGTTGILKKTAANTWTLDTTAYTTNTGTVTKVTAGSGLSIGTTAGGNFTTTGTINHTNSVTAQTTQALYPIKIDACGHITTYGTAVTSLPASDVYDWAKASTKPSYTASEVGLGNVSNNANLNSTTGAKGDIIYWSAANTPAHLTNTSSTTKKFLSITSQVPSWVTLSNSDVGLGNVENTKLSTWTGSSNITTLGTISTGTIPLANISDADDLKAIEALTGAAGLLKKTAANTWTLDTTAYGKGTVTSVRVQATSPLASSTSTAQSSTLNTTISLSDCTPNYVLAGPSSGTTAAAPSYRALVAADIPNHSTDKLDSGTLGIARGGTGATSFTANSVIMSGSTTTSALTTRAVTNNTSATAAATGTNIPTMNTLYYALPKINNAKTYTSNSTFYAPTAGGTSGYVLIGAGTTSAPTWSQTVAIANGGTGATTVDAARTNLQIKYGTTAPSSAGLVNGDIYFYIQ